MSKRTVVIRRKGALMRPKTKIQLFETATERRNQGFVSPTLAVFIFAVLAGAFYLYTINQSAVKGFAIRQLEKDLTEIRKENEALKIEAAKLKSFSYLEESSRNLGMQQQAETKHLEEKAQAAVQRPLAQSN